MTPFFFFFVRKTPFFEAVKIAIEEEIDIKGTPGS